MMNLRFPRLPFSAIAIAMLASLTACSAAPSATLLSSASTTLPQSGTPAAAQCSNAYFPVAQGATWTYAASGHLSGTLTRAITSVKSDGFTDQHTTASGGTQAVNWDCDDGIISMQPDTAPSGLMQAGDLNVRLQVTDTSGVTVPDNLGPDARWNQQSTLDGSASINGQDAPAHDELLTQCVAGTHETVYVKAGSFSALRAECKTDEKLSVTLNGNPIPTEIITDSTIWYAPGVGIVRLEQSAAGGPKTVLELISYHIP